MGVLEREDFASAVTLVESYVFRRAVCAIPTNSLNKTFATLARGLKKDRYLESLKAQLLLLPSYRRFPGDKEFQSALMERDLYNFGNRSYWLRRLENHDRKELVPVGEYTIEHILPQNENLSQQWRDDLGPEWQRVQATYLHTLGNLTLTGYNAEYSDRPFHQKRDMHGGFKESPLRLNAGLGTLERWDEESIKKRAARLADFATTVWRYPSLPPLVYETYKRPAAAAVGYTIEDHPNLADNSPMRPLFEQLRREVLALDPVVTEEFLKHYVAFKAETNFVDVVPLRARLRLTLNLPFHELHDPRGQARDITHVGRLGNGDAEIGISTAVELPYVMGLVRQAFERQMGNGETEA